MTLAIFFKQLEAKFGRLLSEGEKATVQHLDGNRDNHDPSNLVAHVGGTYWRGAKIVAPAAPAAKADEAKAKE